MSQCTHTFIKCMIAKKGSLIPSWKMENNKGMESRDLESKSLKNKKALTSGRKKGLAEQIVWVGFVVIPRNTFDG